MSTRCRSEDDDDDSTPQKKSKTDDSNLRPVEKENSTIPLDVLKAEARERRNSNPDAEAEDDWNNQEDDNHCIICLQTVADRTVLINCAHDRMCFACIKQWAEQSRRCPLCNSPIGTHLIHRIRSQYDYQKYYLPPLRHSPPPENIVIEARTARRTRARRNTTSAEEIERDELDRAIEKRRWVYRHGLFAKHIASNAHTRFRPNLTPQQITNSPELQSRCQMFVRRELRVWPNMDVEFLTNFILSLVKSIDIRTEASIKLISEFLDLDGRTSPAGGTIAEHFAHDIEAAPILTRPSNRPHHNEPGPSHRRASPAERKGKTREREPSEPLEASPRDIDSKSEAEDWVEPPPTHSKEKGKGPANARHSGKDRDDSGRRDIDSGYWQERRGQRSRENRDDRNNRYEDARHSRRYEKSSHEDYSHGTRYSKSASRERHSESRRDSVYDGTHARRGQGDRYPDLDEGAKRQRSRKDKRGEGKMERRRRMPAGWDNFFEDDRRDERTINQEIRSSRYASPSHSCSRSRSRGRSSAPKRTRSPSSYDHGYRSRPGRVNDRRHSSSSDSRVSTSSRPLTTSVPNPPEDNWNELATLPEQSTAAKSGNQASSGGRDSRDYDNSTSEDAVQLGMIVKPITRSRPPRLAPMDAIRMHLQGPTRTSRTAATNKAGDILLPNPEARIVDQDDAELTKRHSTDSREATEAPTVLDGFSPNTTSKPPKLLAEILGGRTLDGENVSPHVTSSTSDNAPVVSYSIRGAAARPKSQLAPLSSFDSTQRVSPGSPHLPNQSSTTRTRLLARLEAAKSVGTISNTDTETSHLTAKLAHRPTPSETPESPVSTVQILAEQEEQRLRDMARNRMLRSATNREGSSPGAPQENSAAHVGHQKKKIDDPSVPAEDDSPTALETERRLRLQARLAARKRDITTLIGAASSADAPPRQPSGGIPTQVDRAP
ncbi:hypothetical protein FRC12_012446 [Ceratobasidium sp. 428]|nr:hypothetical protein FRC12_012446 [Ceratobasidium sp. 428]